MPPMTSRLNTNNYNNNFPSNTHTPRLNSNNYNIDFPPITHTIRNNNTYYPNYITHTPRLNTNNYNNDFPHQFHNIKNNNTYHPNHKLTLHNKGNPSPSYNNSNLTATIENITKTNLNRTYINKLLTDLKIDKKLSLLYLLVIQVSLLLLLHIFQNIMSSILTPNLTIMYYLVTLCRRIVTDPWRRP